MMQHTNITGHRPLQVIVIVNTVPEQPQPHRTTNVMLQGQVSCQQKRRKQQPQHCQPYEAAQRVRSRQHSSHNRPMVSLGLRQPART
jgi:hypothetical protein